MTRERARELQSYIEPKPINHQWPPVEAPTNLQREEPGRTKLDDSINAVSFGFVATAVLISLFLIMAIFERLIRTKQSLTQILLRVRSFRVWTLGSGSMALPLLNLVTNLPKLVSLFSLSLNSFTKLEFSIESLDLCVE